MTELKTQKDIDVGLDLLVENGLGHIKHKDANKIVSIWQKEERKEAIKWVRKLDNPVDYYLTIDGYYVEQMNKDRHTMKWIMEFFNITEDDLK